MHESGPGTAVLLLHGFTSRPSSLQPWIDAVEASGRTVSVPLLPGHGTRWEDLIGVRAEAWMHAAEQAYDALAQEHERVLVGGLSMGGTLALHVAAVRDPAAAIVVNPALTLGRPEAAAAPLAKHFVRTVGAIADDIAKPGVTEGAYQRVPLAAVEQLNRLLRRVRRELPGITTDVTLLRSAVDHIVPDASVSRLTNGLTPRTRTHLRRIPLKRSYHVATLDYDQDVIAAATLAELERLDAAEPSRRRG